MPEREESDARWAAAPNMADRSWPGAYVRRGVDSETLIPPLPTRDCALFFDFDGTLVELAPLPDSVVVRAQVPPMLASLAAAVGGALAVVSGRPVAEIDRHLHPFKLCVAGVHGAERRYRDGFLRRIPVNGLEQAALPVEALCERFPALLMERKPGAIALHYRRAPDLEAQCLATMLEALKSASGMALLRGKMVVEIKPSRATKAMAVRDFMDNASFRHRRPWFFGDDVTDECALDFVQSVGGVAVKIGEGESQAAYRLPDPAALHAWIEHALAHLGAGDGKGGRS